MYLFLDDIREPADVTWVKMPVGVDWNVVRSYDEFVAFITENGLPTLIAFDHDLGHEYDVSGGLNTTEMTGYHCAKWVIEYCLDNDLDFPEYRVHSMNVVGKDNIHKLIMSFIMRRTR